MTEQTTYQAPSSQPLTPPRRRNSAWISGVAALLAVGGIGGGIGYAIGHGSAPGTSPAAWVGTAADFTLTGSITLMPSSNVDVVTITYGSGTCEGVGPYSDMTPGTAVVVADPQGRTVATGALEAGIVSSDPGPCQLPFGVPHVPSGLASYSVTISHRGTQVVSSSEARTGVNLTLGGN